MSKGLVIFDCDGVLVDSERIALRVNLAVGAELGWPITEQEAVEQFLGRSEASILAIISERIGADGAAAWSERFEVEHQHAVDEGLTPVDGVVEALDRISRPTCVASSGTHEKMRHTLGRTGLYERFDGRIFSATEVEHGKPAPDLFLHAASRMGVAPADCVVVEDSQYGARAARAAGMTCFGYAGGLTSAARLESEGAVVFTDMRDLPALLASPSPAP